MDEVEHEVYVDMSAADDDAVKELNETKNRLKEMEEEGAALCEMQAKVEKKMDAVQDFSRKNFKKLFLDRIQRNLWESSSPETPSEE